MKTRISLNGYGTKARGGTRRVPHLKSVQLPFQWPKTIPSHQWNTYKLAIQTARDTKTPFLLGGGFGLAVYTGRWRNTKDIDLYVLPKDRNTIITALTKAGFKDFYRKKPYDRRWIYRSTRDGAIVDIIWSMANRRAVVDKLWFERAHSLSVRDETFQVIPIEELIWCKLYILQRDHCDWTDIFNVLYATPKNINWTHLMKRLGPDVPLLKAVLVVFQWLCPKSAAEIPATVWNMIGLPIPSASHATPPRKRVRYLDSRAWFAAFQPRNRILEV